MSYHSNIWDLATLAPLPIYELLTTLYFSTRILVAGYYVVMNWTYVSNYYVYGSTQEIPGSLDAINYTQDSINAFPFAEHILNNRHILDLGVGVNTYREIPELSHESIFSYDLIRTILTVENDSVVYERVLSTLIFPGEVPMEFFQLFIIFIKFMELGNMLGITGLDAAQLARDFLMNYNGTYESTLGPGGIPMFEFINLFDINIFDILIVENYLESLYNFLFSVDLVNEQLNYSPVYRELHPFLYHLYIYMCGLDTYSGDYLHTWASVTMLSDL